MDNYSMPPRGEPEQSTPRVRHTFTAPLLCAAVFLLLLLTQTVDLSKAATSPTEVYLSLVAIQLFVFMLPSVFYIRYRGLDMRSEMRMRLFAPDKIMFVVLCSLVLIVSSILVSAVSGAVGESVYSYEYISGSYTVENGAGIYYAICFALLPAICEDFLFRGIVMSEYQRTSIPAAVVINSLFFAMLHFDLTKLPFFFISGLVLSMCAYAANSVIASACVHLAYNLFALFGGPLVNNVISSLGELTLIIISLTVFLLLLLTLTFGECQRIYASYSKKNKDSSYAVKHKKGTGALRFFMSLLSPMSLVCIVMYITVALLQK